MEVRPKPIKFNSKLILYSHVPDYIPLSFVGFCTTRIKWHICTINSKAGQLQHII